MLSTSPGERSAGTQSATDSRDREVAADRPLHIVLVNQWYPPDGGWGGTAAYAYYAARAFAALGHHVTVLSTGRPGVEVEADGVVVHRLKPIAEPWWSRRIPVAGPYLRTVRHLIHSYRVSRAVAAIDRERPADIVEFPEINAEGLVYLLRRRRAPVAVRCHTPHLLLKPSFTREECYFDFDFIWKLERLSIRRADTITSPSDDLRRRIAHACKLSAEQVAVIPHPVPLSDQDHTDNDRESQTVRLLHVGRLERAKGAFTLIRAIRAAARQIPNLRITFVGATRTMVTGEAVVDVLKRELAGALPAERIAFTGYVEQEDLPKYYREADICVVPSELYESFSYTCAQAMAAGRPIVATRTGGIPEVVADGECGILVPPGDDAALASAIVQLARDPDLRTRQGAAGRARTRTLFDPLAFGRAAVAAYCEASVER